METIKKLAGSRKVFLCVLSVFVWGLGRFGLEISQDDLLPIVGPIWGVIFGISLEGIGKGKALPEEK